MGVGVVGEVRCVDLMWVGAGWIGRVRHVTRYIVRMLRTLCVTYITHGMRYAA